MDLAFQTEPQPTIMGESPALMSDDALTLAAEGGANEVRRRMMLRYVIPGCQEMSGY